MALVDDLKAAKALIDTPEKWRKGGYGYGSGSLCASGAICEAVDDRGAPYNHPAWFAVYGQVPDRKCISEYNDHPDTTHADIMALFDRAIERAALSTAESGK